MSPAVGGGLRSSLPLQVLRQGEPQPAVLIPVRGVRVDQATRNRSTPRRHVASIPVTAWRPLIPRPEALNRASFRRNRYLPVSQTRHENRLTVELDYEMKTQRDEPRSEEHTSELQSPDHLVCRLLLEKKKKNKYVSFRNVVNQHH